MCSVLGLSWPQLSPHGPHTCHSLCLDYSSRLFTWRTLRSQLKYDMSRGGSFGQLATLGPYRNMCPVLYPRGTLLFPLWPIPPFEIPPCLGDAVFQSCLLYGTMNSARTLSFALLTTAAQRLHANCHTAGQMEVSEAGLHHGQPCRLWRRAA